MNYLVDTHVLLWTILSPKKLSRRVKNILLDPKLIKYVSAITFWEISLKYQLRKIDLKGILPDKLPIIAKDTGFEIINLDCDIASSFHKLPKVNHKDPFDRMLAWQAIRKDYFLLTQDKEFSSYNDNGLNIVW
ncbi:MAG: type II toxin-antitoxin system VapC family toxin [Candidatus Daviesbacteria bacterium]|nr:type II toxin-antitoxin system VapC family toxin [Candidatus Daviesbacteria bacterium]